MIDFRVTLKDKLTLLIATIIFLCIAIVSLNSYVKSKDSLIASIRSELKDMATSLALSIDPDEVEKALAAGENSEPYTLLKQKLHRFTLIGDGKINGAYIMTMTGKKDIWQFVANDEILDKSSMARLHEELDVSRMDEMKKGIAFATADPDISQGRFGRRLSGYAPIHDRRSRPIGVLGLDMRASDIEKLKTEMLDVTLLYLLIGAIASLVLGRIGASTIIGPITALSAGVRDIQAKKYGTLINMQRDDEIGELIRVFNQMSAKLFEVDRIKSSFLSVISHELYTPLTPIRGGAEQLKTITGLTEDFKQIVNMIDHHSKKLQDLIDELLDFSWLEVKEWKLNKEPVSIQHVVEEASAEMKVKLQEKGMVLEINIPLDTPTILADKKRVIHVVKIMLDNAIKFSPEKSPLYLTIARGPDKVMVELLDFGIGMSPENLEKIFDAFYQIEDHLTRSHGGVGLGLAIAKRIIEAHSGLIWAESPGPGRGSRFTFSLPIR